jgi:hypothetical protein
MLQQYTDRKKDLEEIPNYDLVETIIFFEIS